MSTASLGPAAAIYREEQWFAPWVYAILGGVWLAVNAASLLGEGRAAPGLTSLGVAFGVGLPLLVILVFFLKMSTVVDPTEVRVWFGWIPSYRRRIPLDSIVQVEVVTYRPLRDFGGWGIRFGLQGQRALTCRGDEGVRLKLRDGSTLIIGSQQPELLARCLQSVVQPLS